MPAPRGKIQRDSASPDAKAERLALGLAQGMTRIDAAAYAEMGERTVYTKLKDPAFVALVADHRSRIVGQTVGKLASAGAAAADKLKALLSDPSANVQLQAARSLLELTVKLRTYNELADRIAALEARVESMPKPDNHWERN